MKFDGTRHRRPAQHGRSLRGERGLKSPDAASLRREEKSLPSRGAWIEIGGGESFGGVSVRRSLRGERGLKLDRALSVLRPGRRFLRGDRGLRTGLCT